MHIFYSPDIVSEENSLDAFESKHCVNVLRLRSGDQINVIDGNGGFYLARLTGTNPNQCTFRILETYENFGKRSYYLHIAIAPTKSRDRFEWFLEKSTEIGIDEITPLRCDRSAKINIRTDRCEKIILSATKQSIQAYMPKLNPPIPYRDFIQQEFAGSRIIAHCGESTKPLLKEIVTPGEYTCILIGPEGDFTPEEILRARENNFQEADLGPSRLRTETAGVVACATVSLANQ